VFVTREVERTGVLCVFFIQEISNLILKLVKDQFTKNEEIQITITRSIVSVDGSNFNDKVFLIYYDMMQFLIVL
jgi:hypothetical protein